MGTILNNRLMVFFIFLCFSTIFSCLHPPLESGDEEAVSRSATQRRLRWIASYNSQNGLPSGSIENIAIGPQGQVYVRTFSNFESSFVTLFRRENNIPHFSSVAVPSGMQLLIPITVAPDGRVLSSTGNGVSIVQNQGNNLIPAGSISYQINGSSAEISDVNFDSAGRLYVSRMGSIAVYDQGLPANLTTPPSRILDIPGQVYTLIPGSNGRMYTTGASRRISVITDGNSLTNRDTLMAAGEMISAMVFDPVHNRLIVGTDEGLFILNEDADQRLAHYTTAQGLTSDFIFMVGASPNGRVILAYSAAGELGGGNAGDITLIVDGIVREHYSLTDLHLTDDPTNHIRAIEYNHQDRNWYIGTSFGELAVVAFQMETDADTGTTFPRRDDHAPHRIVARKGADNHSSILPHPPLLPEPVIIEHNAPATRTWWSTIKQAWDELSTAYAHVHAIARRNDQHKEAIGWWKSYRERYYDVWIKQKNGKMPSSGTMYIEAPGNSYVYGSIHEELDNFQSTNKFPGETRIVIEAISMNGTKKDITLRATLYDTVNTHAIQDPHSSAPLMAGAPQRLRVEVVDHPTDSFYISLLTICLIDAVDDNFGHDIVIPIIAGKPSYLPATIEKVNIYPSQFPGYNTAVWPEFTYTKKENLKYTASAKLYAGQYYYYFVYDFGPDYLREDMRYKIQNVIDGTTRWSKSFDVDRWQFGGYGTARYARTSSLPEVELDCDEHIIGMEAWISEGYMATGPSGVLDSSRGNDVHISW